MKSLTLFSNRCRELNNMHAHYVNMCVKQRHVSGMNIGLEECCRLFTGTSRMHMHALHRSCLSKCEAKTCKRNIGLKAMSTTLLPKRKPIADAQPTNANPPLPALANLLRFVTEGKTDDSYISISSGTLTRTLTEIFYCEDVEWNK
jgi:hypothetical protein